ncbi:MAG: efflux RND transporter periplasmic adaptor subunit [Nitrospirota bacterium]
MHVNIRRRIIIITAITLVICAVIYGFLPKPVPVEVAMALRGPLRVAIDEEGKTRVKDRYVISAPVAGYMRRIRLDVGDTIKKGQVVAELEPLRSAVLDPRSRAESEAAVSAANAALNSALENARAASAEAGYAMQKLKRVKELYDSEYISKDFLDKTDSDAKRTEANRLSAEAAVKLARAELEKARAALGYSAAEGIENQGRVVAVRTPVDGRVLKLHHESEGAVNAGEPLIDIGNPEELEVKVEVLSADAVNIKKGTPVFFERWGGDSPLAGSVRIVEPTAFTKVSSLGVEEQRVLVIADITSLPESWQRLGDGYRVEASFVIWERKDVLQVPASALFRKGDGWAVFVMENKRAHIRRVEAGRRNGLTAEIISGLSEGEIVIAHPDDSIRDGIRVRLR